MAAMANDVSGPPQEETKYSRRYGTREEVFQGEAAMTRGGLKKADLMISRTGRLVSRKKSEQAKKNYKQFGFKKRVVAVAVKEEKPKQKRRKRKKIVKE